MYSLIARRRKIYDTRATLHKEGSNYSYSKNSGYTSGCGYRYRTRTDPKRDYNFNYNDDDYSRHDNYSSKQGNKYHSFTFRNIFEWTPFHKLFGKIVTQWLLLPIISLSPNNLIIIMLMFMFLCFFRLTLITGD